MMFFTYKNLSKLPSSDFCPIQWLGMEFSRHFMISLLIGSMGLVYLPTFTIKICPMDPMGDVYLRE